MLGLKTFGNFTFEANLDDGKKEKWNNLFNHSRQRLRDKKTFVNNLNKTSGNS